MRKILRLTPLFIALLVIASCQSQVEKVEQSTKNKFEDPNIVQIYKLIDQRKTDSLINFLRHENDTYRYEAAIGFGSIQDTSAIIALSYSLNDSSPKVRRAAAYSLGQMYDTAAIAPLIKSLEVEDSVFVRQELLESLGKVITQEKLNLLQYWPLKTQEDKKGLAWGLYRAGLRNVHDGVSIDLALTLLDSSNSYETRLGAAHFLSRSPNLDLTGRTAFIRRSAFNDTSLHVRMACASALKYANEPISKESLVKLVKDKDYRVRVNALRSLSGLDVKELSQIFIDCLKDKNINVAIVSAEIINNNYSSFDTNEIQNTLKDISSGRVKGLLYSTLLQLSDLKKDVIASIITEYNDTNDPYYKAYLLSALGNSIHAHEFVITKTFAEEHHIISTSGVGALAQMRYSPEFPKELEYSFAEIFKQAIETKDLAMVSIASGVIIDPDLNYKSIYYSADFLSKVRSELVSPKDIEAIKELDKAIAYFKGVEYSEPQNTYNHPINWELVRSINKNTEAIVTTPKGSITIQLLVENAPGSVANFVSLSRKGYYNEKNFHRVVPNFVVQGGCNRGDGFGGENYSIRSELANLRYNEGSVGMASAGKDTEGTQWFITHSPTPHLDGKYTIFAQVTEGMDIVHNLEVGDKITSIVIK